MCFTKMKGEIRKRKRKTWDPENKGCNTERRDSQMTVKGDSKVTAGLESKQIDRSRGTEGSRRVIFEKMKLME